MRNTLLSTVGTSLFEGNLINLSESTHNKPDNWREIKLYFEKGMWEKLANELLKVSPSDRLCGAEINTIEQLKNKKGLDLRNIIFLVSDTESGINSGKVLKYYFKKRKDLNLQEVEYKCVEDLQDKEPKKFKTKGLRNLVRAIGELTYKYGVDNVAIDATGGYKAQIAVAVIIGQALNIPVFYKHERFSEIIDFPPLPISLDYDILGRYADIFIDFERGKAFSKDELIEFDDKLLVFLTEVNVDDNTIYELNPLGQIYLISFFQRQYRNIAPKELEDAERKEPAFSEHHYPKGFKDFVIKVWRENRWIKTCHSLPYHKQKAIKGIGFIVSHDHEKILVGSYIDKDGFGARFRIDLWDNHVQNLTWAAYFLNHKYRDND